MQLLRRVVQAFRRQKVGPVLPVVPVRLSVYNTTDARMSLAYLLRRVSYGEEIVIARAGVPVAKLVPYRGERVRQGIFRSHLRVVRDPVVRDPVVGDPAVGDRDDPAASTPTRSWPAAST